MEQNALFFAMPARPKAEPAARKAWKGIETPPPPGLPVLVWDGSAISVAKLQRDMFLAETKGGTVLNRWDIPLTIPNVSHWSYLPEAPEIAASSIAAAGPK